jgi:hypothetical protein
MQMYIANSKLVETLSIFGVFKFCACVLLSTCFIWDEMNEASEIMIGLQKSKLTFRLK